MEVDPGGFFRHVTHCRLNHALVEAFTGEGAKGMSDLVNLFLFQPRDFPVALRRTEEGRVVPGQANLVDENPIRRRGERLPELCRFIEDALQHVINGDVACDIPIASATIFSL